MAVISFQNRFIYLLNPRTASTATAQALLDSAKAEFVPAENIVDDEGNIVVQRKHTTMEQLVEYELISKDQVDTFFKFVTVRNPYDSMVSAWAKKVHDYVHLLDNPNSWVNRMPDYAAGLRRAAGMSFPEWIAAEYLPKLKRGRGGSVNRNFIRNVDHVLRYENLQHDFSQIVERLGLPKDFQIPVVNVTKGRETKDYRTYYDDESRDIVYRAFKDEIEQLGYEF